ncbi:MAG: trypsin-like peptidase domain-containing protein [Oscillospiraceae bacterium]|nr:trypsin-like peptidase domain-containing protein [Oscillospiraceae bacterium]
MEPVEKKKRPALALVSLLVVFTLLAGGTGGVIGYHINQNAPAAPAAASPLLPDPPTAPSPEPPRLPAASDSSAAVPAVAHDGEMTIQEVFLQGDTSAVAVTTVSGGSGVFGQGSAREAAGSGFILTADGHILTNHHVVEDASAVTVRLHDGTEYPAEIVGGDPVTDVAVLKIDAPGLTPVRLGDSDALMVGDQVVAIGNPLGELSNSLTVGYISAKKRIVYIDGTPRLMLQTDASVSPGNSGGPLINLRGEVVGVVSAKTIASGVEGIGFAIPINIAADIAAELIQHGQIPARPLLGVTYQDAPPDGSKAPKGVYIAEVADGSPAAKAGVKPGDVILSFNGERTTGGAELLLALNALRVGAVAPITVYRNGEEITLTVTLDAERDPAPPQRPAIPWGR